MREPTTETVSEEEEEEVPVVAAAAVAAASEKTLPLLPLLPLLRFAVEFVCRWLKYFKRLEEHSVIRKSFQEVRPNFFKLHSIFIPSAVRACLAHPVIDVFTQFVYDLFHIRLFNDDNYFLKRVVHPVEACHIEIVRCNSCLLVLLHKGVIEHDAFIYKLGKLEQLTLGEGSTTPDVK